MSLQRGVALQRDVAKFMGLYNGGNSIDDDEQKKINKQVHLVPLSYVRSEYDGRYPQYVERKLGINGSLEKFKSYIKVNIEQAGKRKIHVLVLCNHSNAEIFCLLANGSPYISKEDLKNTFKDSLTIDYVVLMGCNMGNLSEYPNIASEFANYCVTNRVQNTRNLPIC